MNNKFSISIHIGWPSPSPAPGWVMETLDYVEVTQSDQAPNGFQIRLHAQRTPQQYTDFPVLAADTFSSGTRIWISANVDGDTTLLMDGMVTHWQVLPSDGQNPGQILITGEDVSVAMSLYQYSVEYPFSPDMAIAGLVMAKWATIGVLPDIKPTPTSAVTFSDVPQQAQDDRSYLQQLAEQHGYVFCILPKSIGHSDAYWGPPLRDRSPQPTLTLAGGSQGNVESIDLSYDMLAPRRLWGAALNIETDLTVPVGAATSTRDGTFAAKPGLTGQGMFVRTTLFDHEGYGVLRSMASAQALANISTDRVVVVNGKLDCFRYGGVLTAPGTVYLRGAGQSSDGHYYVQSVTHRASRESYEQDFTLTREGMGSTVSSVPPH